MAKLEGFNANEVEPFVPFDAIPAGEYMACIVESEQKDTSAGDGSMLKLDFQIIEGEFEGRHVFENLNLNNPSEKAVQIARAKLSAICRAIDVLEPQDSNELHDKPVSIKVTQEKRKDNGEMTNRITSFNSPSKAKESKGEGGDFKAPWKK